MVVSMYAKAPGKEGYAVLDSGWVRSVGKSYMDCKFLLVKFVLQRLPAKRAARR